MHDFRITTFTSPTYCEHCSGFLWGIAKQGCRCTKCDVAAHKKCAAKIATACVGDRGLATLLKGNGGQATNTSSSTSMAATYNNSQEMGNEDSCSGSNKNEHRSKYIKQLDAAFWEQVVEETKVNELVSNQAEQPLSLFQTLPTNFMHFTAKLAPVGIVERGIRDIVLWKRPRNSVIAMSAYSVYCLRPNLLLATPLALLISYILFNYYNSGYACAVSDGNGQSSDTGSSKSSNSKNNNSSSSKKKQSNSSETSGSQLPAQFGTLRPSLFSIRTPAAGSLLSSSISTATIPTMQRGGRLRDRKRRQASEPYPSITSTSTDSLQLPSVSTKAPGALMTKLAAGVEIGMVDIAGSDDSLVAIQQTNQVADAPKTKGRKLVRAYDNMDTAGQSRKRSDGIESSGKSSGTIDLALILGVATFGSAKYTENVHTTQNLTGTYVSVYDWVAAHNYMVDWSHPEEAGKILTLCICAQIGVLVAVYWIPWYLIFLVGGNFGLLAMSPHMRAFAKVYGVEFMLYLHERIIAKWQQLRRHLASTPVTGKLSAKHLGSSGTIDAGISFASPTLLGQGHGEEEEEDDDDNEGEDDRSLGIRDGYTTPPLLSLASSSGSSSLSLMRRPQTVSVFENQRWWIGFGWIPRLGSNERAKWSDESGRQRFASVNDFMPAEGYEWADEGEGWEIDRRWALPVSTDKDGWVYSDNFWRRPASSASAVSSYTRRRKWVRCIRPAVRIDDLIASAAATAT